MPPSFLWYDLETFGLDPRGDRIAQFAGVRTNGKLDIVGERIVLYAKPGGDWLPNPEACLVHGISPQHAEEAGIGEYELALRLRAEMTQAGTTSVGFNTAQFDDEFVRNLFYRNLLDPYEREWANGCSRWDVIDLARAARDLRPEGIVWPADEEGKPLFRLEALAKANGIAHENAHDAMGDVLATIGFARLIKERQPKLFEWHWKNRGKAALKRLVRLDERAALVHSSAIHTSQKGCTTLVAPVAFDPEKANHLVALDLRYDPGEIIDLPVEELRRRAFTRRDELEVPRLPLVDIQLNKSPFLAEAKVMDPATAERLGIDLAACERHRAILSKSRELLQKLVAVYAMSEPPEEPDDPDLMIYSGGFFPDEDRERLDRLHLLVAEKGAAGAKQELYSWRFRDERIPQMIRRLYARNFPETLGAEEGARWRDFCASRLQLPPAPRATSLAVFNKILDQCLADPATPARDRALLLALLQWRSRLETEVLAYRGK
ncbi:MAG TPA: exodeoxyribonuclease I [Rectinemataceae bacterium]|nr:exodeoxyribonuclease I [Rectinemataceae bacterium]